MVAHQCDRGKASIQLYGPRAAPTGSLSHFGGGVAAQTLHFGDVHPHATSFPFRRVSSSVVFAEKFPIGLPRALVIETLINN